VNINWKLKSLAFRYIEAFSLHQLLYFLQKNVTRRARVRIGEIDQDWLTHRQNLAALQHPRVIEFGAGKSLAQNIFLASHFASQTVVDLFPMLDLAQFNAAAEQVGRLTGAADFTPCTSVAEVEQRYGIRYLAPFDVRKTSFSDASFDACISTNTLEHIPRESILEIFSELKRIVRPGGLISAVIDYSDHYSHTDASIGPLNFLSFSADEFRKYNHAVHFQNRLRHHQFEDLFASMGLRILRNEAQDLQPLPRLVAAEFPTHLPTTGALKGVFLLEV